jgi:hypothetical protein
MFDWGRLFLATETQLEEAFPPTVRRGINPFTKAPATATVRSPSLAWEALPHRSIDEDLGHWLIERFMRGRGAVRGIYDDLDGNLWLLRLLPDIARFASAERSDLAELVAMLSSRRIEGADFYVLIAYT